MIRSFSTPFVLLAFLIACLSPQSIQAFEINNLEINSLRYCSVTIKQDDGDLYTILILKIELPKILDQLKVIDFDCSI